ncbi:aldolase [Pararhizobium sp. BT-229]|uniref:aldolase n=1 Tax=Pararhizobium sp. BT-229 TaxID=2986923 RepID=UPI0021F76143|nr:aldolase [Pararhizobium sp. BT-229]MCV9965389.1 aldolase [Pararhizobium sp. BT-229]
MSVNRFESTPLLICATPEALALADAPTGRPLTVIVDIREEWGTAGDAVKNLLDSRTSQGAGRSTLLRIRMPDDDGGQDALGRLIAFRPDGFVLSGCRGTADIQKLDVMLGVAEAENGLAARSTAILAEAGESPAFFLSPHSLQSISARLAGLIFDGAALANETASQAVNVSAGRPGAPMLFARAAIILKGRQASLPCHELIADDTLSGEALWAARETSLADGFSGVIARSAVQLAALAEN